MRPTHRVALSRTPIRAFVTAATACLLLCACTSSGWAEDLAVWKSGAGSIAGVPAAAGAPIAAGTLFIAGAAPATVALTTAPGSIMTLGPDAGVILSVEKDDAGTHLIITAEVGRIEVEIANKGSYADVHARGAAIDVRITGTLFLIERVHRDADYVALINGHVKVRLRREIAEALGKTNADVDLYPHQGLPGTTSGGLGSVEPLVTRPGVSGGHTLHEQGTAPPVGDGGWGADQNPTGQGTVATAPGGTSALTGSITSAVVQTNTQSVFQNIDQGPLSVQIIGTALSPGGSTPLGPPPGHPTGH